MIDETQIFKELSTIFDQYQKKSPKEDLMIFHATLDGNNPSVAIDDTDFKRIDKLIQDGKRHDDLNLVIQTWGGSYSAALKIYSLLRTKYNHIRVFVIDISMSCGTMWAFGSDDLYIHPDGILGAFDPQFSLLPDKNMTGMYGILKYFGLNHSPSQNGIKKVAPTSTFLRDLQKTYYEIEDIVVSAFMNCKLIDNNSIDDILKRFFRDDHQDYVEHALPIPRQYVMKYIPKIKDFNKFMSAAEIYQIFTLSHILIVKKSLSRFYMLNDYYSMRT